MIFEFLNMYLQLANQKSSSNGQQGWKEKLESLMECLHNQENIIHVCI